VNRERRRTVVAKNAGCLVVNRSALRRVQEVTIAVLVAVTAGTVATVCSARPELGIPRTPKPSWARDEMRERLSALPAPESRGRIVRLAPIDSAVVRERALAARPARVARYQGEVRGRQGWIADGAEDDCIRLRELGNSAQGESRVHHALRADQEPAVSRARQPERRSEIGAMAMFLAFVLAVVAVVAIGFF